MRQQTAFLSTDVTHPFMVVRKNCRIFTESPRVAGCSAFTDNSLLDGQHHDSRGQDLMRLRRRWRRNATSSPATCGQNNCERDRRSCKDQYTLVSPLLSSGRQRQNQKC